VGVDAVNVPAQPVLLVLADAVEAGELQVGDPAPSKRGRGGVSLHMVVLRPLSA
jgi:hypothetical protein